jgi:UDP-N-acetylglucosamine--N-acetylmuramyl-(pentapeptide) pyrophosphoryl-undecaprenol N-acetylglucosamine transferase
VIERLRRRRPGSRFLLHTTGRASEARLPVPAFVEREVVASPRPGPGLADRAWFPGRFARAVDAAGRSLRHFRPHGVIGLGGYGSVATVVAARAQRVPVVLLEQNAVPGKANRALAPWARAVGVAFDEAAGVFRSRACLTGNPVRTGIAGRVRDAERFGLEAAPPVLGIVGGSLGARALNWAAAAGAGELAAAGIQVVHLAGAEGREEVERAYARAGVRACVRAFERDMGAFYATADLVLGRAGGTTVAELAATGTPAVLVPLRLHAYGHQRRNAEALVAEGGAIAVEEGDLLAGGLRRHVLPLLRDPARLARMAGALRGVGRPEAADAVADLVVSVVGEGRR